MPRASSHGSRIPVALIGCGRVAEIFHLRNLIKSRTLDLVRVADLSHDRLDWVRGNWPHLAVTDDPQDVMRDDAVAATLVAVPPAEHAAVAVAALQAGKHVYLEKPIACHMRDAERIVAAARSAGTVAMIGFNFRFNPIFKDAKDRLRAGALGRMLGIQGVFQAVAREATGWRSDASLGSSALFDLAIHHIDLVSDLLPERFTSVGAHAHSIVLRDDTVALTLLCADGTPVQLLASAAAGTHSNRLTLFGTKGSLEVDLLDARPREIEQVPGRLARLIRLRRRLGALHPARLARSPGHEPSFAAALEHFGCAIQGRAPAKPDMTDGRDALAIAEAAQRSARSGGSTIQLECCA